MTFMLPITRYPRICCDRQHQRHNQCCTRWLVPTAVNAASHQHQYTAWDNSSSYKAFHPLVINISNLLAGATATEQQIHQVQQECAGTGFLAVTGHGISSHQLQQLFGMARQLFDLPYQQKLQLVVKDMQAGRGYEISPEHKAYMQEYQRWHGPGAEPCGPEPSAALGILSERFCCGPELTASQQQDPYYASELGRVFFPPNAWPAAAVLPELQPQMARCFSRCETIAAALMQLFAASLGLEQHHFDSALRRHHSNMQVANYPSLRVDPGPQHLRKKAHVDSGTLTLLASEDWLPGSSWQAGGGGLQLLSPQQEWLEVTVPPGALLVNLGSLMSRWTNGLWKSTLHRVTNPPVHRQAHSRRLSMAFFHKPAYDAVVEVLPTCYSNSGRAGDNSFSTRHVLPAEPLYPPAVVGDLTRQGVLHKYRHLPPEEASRLYHAHLADLRNAGPVL